MAQRSGLHHVYKKHGLRADELVWGRKSDPLTRRGFLRGAGLGAMSAALGMSIPFNRYLPAGLIPAALADSEEPFEIPGKSGLVLLNDRPLNAETPAHLLDDPVTPAERLFVRNNGIPPRPEQIDQAAWTLEIGGESCLQPQSLTIAELKQHFAAQTLQLQIECGGNGRAEFYPPARGNQWTTGAVGCPEWTGVRMSDLLDFCGVADDAVYVAYESADTHLSGEPGKLPISRGVPLSKARQEESMVVWAMNGEDLPPLHGYPLRMLCAGWPASVNGKWLKRILVRDRVHDGPKMTGQSYRVPCTPVAPGADVADEDMCIIESMPVKSLITFPKSGITHSGNSGLAVRGHAWAGENAVARMFVSIDFGMTWQQAELDAPANRLAWQHWRTELTFPEKGYYEIWARAVDDQGHSQPSVLPGWNPRGYLNNACHRIAVSVLG